MAVLSLSDRSQLTLLSMTRKRAVCCVLLRSTRPAGLGRPRLPVRSPDSLRAQAAYRTTAYITGARCVFSPARLVARSRLALSVAVYRSTFPSLVLPRRLQGFDEHPAERETVMAAFHARLPSHGAVDDTPTRPSSAAASFSSNLTSLKPPRTQPHHQPGKPSLSGMTSRAAAGLAPADLNRLDSRANNQPPSGLRPSSRASATALSALKASDLDSLFEQDDQAAAPIEADNTELARRRAEASFQREMEDLRNAVLSPSSASDVSLSRKPHRQQNSRESATDAQRRRQFDDETASSRSGTSASSYESLRIGLTGAAKAVPPSGLAYDGHPQQRGDDDDDDLTYVTLPRSAMTSPDRTATPGRPAAASAGPPPASVRPATAPAPSSASNLFSSPRPFVSSAGAGIPAASRGPFATGPNQAAGSPNRSSFERPSPGAHSFATTSTIAAAPSAPFAQRASPFAANPPLSSFRSPATGTSPANALNNGTPLPAAPHRPSPLGRNSPILASASPTATATSTPAQSRSFGASHRTTAGFAQMAQATGADRTTMTALPDRTGITDFLRSPERERQVLERERRTEAAASAGGPDVAQARRSAAQSSECTLDRISRRSNTGPSQADRSNPS